MSNNDAHNIKDALSKAIYGAKSKFIEAIDVSIQLGVDSKTGHVKGVVDLPHGLRKEVKIAILSDAKSTIVDDKSVDIIVVPNKPDKSILKLSFYDWYVCTPDLMPKIASSLAKYLGPKGLMPNPKFGTVSDDLPAVVDRLKSGIRRFKSEKSGIVHFKLGNTEFSVDSLIDNLNALLEAITSNKPNGVHIGSLIKKLYISSTMGEGYLVSLNSIKG